MSVLDTVPVKIPVGRLGGDSGDDDMRTGSFPGNPASPPGKSLYDQLGGGTAIWVGKRLRRLGRSASVAGLRIGIYRA